MDESTVNQTVNEEIFDFTVRTGKLALKVYEPQNIEIVLGAGCKPDKEVNLDRVERDKIPVRKRKGGGGTVVLSPGQVVVALAAKVSTPFRNREYMQWINSFITESLQTLGIKGIEERGISDLAIGERKILGSSLHRKRLFLFYQSSLLVNNDISLFDRYLLYPPKEPEYRSGRSHSDFCTNLFLSGYNISVDRVITQILNIMGKNIEMISIL